MSESAESRKTQRRLDRAGFWRGHIERCETLGIPIVGYCREQGISQAAYHRWKLELKRRGAYVAAASGAQSPMVSSASPVLPFAEVRVVSAGGAVVGEDAVAIEVMLPGGRRVGVRPGFDAATLAQVLRIVEGLGC